MLITFNNFLKENVQNELVSNLYKEEILSSLLRETDDIAIRRSTCITVYLVVLHNFLNFINI